MTTNEGMLDRGLRVVVGLLLLAWAFGYFGAPSVWGWIGVIPLVTGLIGYCPVYQLLGMNTCGTKTT